LSSLEVASTMRPPAQADIVEGRAAIERGGIEADGALDRVAHRGGEALAIGYIVLAGTGDYGNVFDAEVQIGVRAFDVDLVGLCQEVDQGFLGFGHFAIVEGADVEVEALEGLGAHLGLLGHRRRGPAQNDPHGLGHSDLEVHRLDPVALVEFHRGGGHIGELGDVVAAAQTDIGLDFFHAVGLALADELHGLLLAGLDQLALDAVALVGDQGHAADLACGADQGDDHILGDIKGFDEDLFALLQAGGVVDEQVGEGVEARIVHVSSL
jgi:hypothetical protein